MWLSASSPARGRVLLLLKEDIDLNCRDSEDSKTMKVASSLFLKEFFRESASEARHRGRHLRGGRGPLRRTGDSGPPLPREPL